MASQPFAFPPPPPPPPRKDPKPQLDGPYEPTTNASQYDFRGSRGSWRGQPSHGLGTIRGSRGQGQGPARNSNGYASQGLSRHDRGNRDRFGAPTGNSSSRGRATFSYQSSIPRDDTHENYGSRAPSRSEHDQQGYEANGAAAAPKSYASSPLNFSQKRSHADAFTRPQPPSKRPQAAPAVPSFTADISRLLGQSPATSSAQSSVKSMKAPKHNMLGLTPSMNGAELSSDDEDEEAKLALDASSGSYHFEYRGQISTLKSAADIAAWIAERRKKYPTQARAEIAKREEDEKRKTRDEERKVARDAAIKVRDEKRFSESHRRKEAQVQDASNVDRQNSRTGADLIAVNLAAKAKLKAEKLRVKAQKAERQLVKAEKALRRAQAGRIVAEDSKTEAVNGSGVKDADGYDSAISLVDHEEFPSTRKGDAAREAPPVAQQQQPLGTSNLVDTDSHPDESAGIESGCPVGSPSFVVPDADTSSEDSEPSDSEDTSSSGSSVSTDSDDSEDSTPEEITTKRQAPDHVAPSRRTPPSTARSPEICRAFLKTGKCKFGNRCRHSHERPSQRGGHRSRNKFAAVGPKPKRKGLWEVMVEKEQQQERELEQMLKDGAVTENSDSLQVEPK